MSKTLKIERPIQCGVCDDFSTVNGNEMYKHFTDKHDIVWSYISYSNSWSVGSGNTYDWLHSDTITLDADECRKCDNCHKPFIAYERKDDCDECRQLPKVQLYGKYTRNRSTYTYPEGSVYYNRTLKCDNCGEISCGYEAFANHGELKKIDGFLRYSCNPQ